MTSLHALAPVKVCDKVVDQWLMQIFGKLESQWSTYDVNMLLKYNNVIIHGTRSFHCTYFDKLLLLDNYFIEILVCFYQTYRNTVTILRSAHCLFLDVASLCSYTKYLWFKKNYPLVAVIKVSWNFHYMWMKHVTCCVTWLTD